MTYYPAVLCVTPLHSFVNPFIHLFPQQAIYLSIQSIINPIAYTPVCPSLSSINHTFMVLCLLDVETIGANSEFYKFNIRYHISIIYKTIWEIQEHQRKIVD